MHDKIITVVSNISKPETKASKNTFECVFHTAVERARKCEQLVDLIKEEVV